METSFDYLNRIWNLNSELTGLELYYNQKKATLAFHLGTVESTHPILVEIRTSIEDTRNERNLLEAKAKELETIEDVSYFELLIENGTNKPFDIEESERWLSEINSLGLSEPPRILGYWVRSSVLA